MKDFNKTYLGVYPSDANVTIPNIPRKHKLKDTVDASAPVDIEITGGVITNHVTPKSLAS